MTDLVKALREEAALLFSPGFSLIQTKNLMIEAAAKIEQLQKENDVLSLKAAPLVVPIPSTLALKNKDTPGAASNE